MNASREGKPVPQVTFRTRSNNEWRSVTSEQLSKARR